MVARIVLVTAVFSSAVSSLLPAAEPYREFVQGLRDRQYFDLAEEYLNQIEHDAATPPDVRVLIPFEKGLTLLERSRTLRSPETRSRLLDAADALFEQFTAAAADHPLLAQANTERARILLNKARVEIWQADATADAGEREAFRQRARQWIAQSREVTERAHDQHQAAWETLKGFIPEDQTARRAERERAEGLYMQAQVDLARCTYEEAQTYERGSDARTELLNRAAAQFEAIHHKYRSQIAGLHARMWQGKCFEEQDDIRKALGIYKEILDHPGEKLRALQDRARWFRLICLNHDSRSDHRLVVDEATAWRQESPDRLRTLAGLGIQYELARAQRALAESEPPMSPAVRASKLTSALEHAQAVARYPGPLKAPAVALAQQVMAAVNRDGGEPKDFDTAFAAANLHLEEAKQLNAQLVAAQSHGDADEVQQLRQELTATAGETRRLYDRALKLVSDRDDPEQVNIARFRLAYAYFLEQKDLEAGVMGGYIAHQAREQFPDIAVESAYLTLAAFDHLFAVAAPGDREFEMQQVMRVAEFIAETWPESDRAMDARLSVARLLRQDAQPLSAAEWYAQVPESASQFADAQLGAGQSYWNAYLTRSTLPADQRPAAEELTQWKRLAEQHLAAGVEARQRQLSADAATPDDLVLGKLSLVQIRNSGGVYADTQDQQGAITLLQAAPHSVIDAVSVPPDQPRPTTPGSVTSLPIAIMVYQQLLRAQIGARDLEGARQTRQQLEALAAEGEDAGALTQIYVEFGRELEKELAQLRAAGDTARVDEVRSDFEAFLNDLFERTEGQTFSSLLWIAETYTGLAEGSADDEVKSAVYFEKAADTYASILDRQQDEPDFIADAGQLIGVKLRLVNCRREQGEFAAAEAIMQEVLRERPNAIDAQMEAARLYEQWAAAGHLDAEPKLRAAIQGRQDAGPMWGWAVIAQKLQRAIDYSRAPADYPNKHWEARYHLAHCQFVLADEQTTTQARHKLLNDVRFGIQRLIAITDEMPEAEWRRFDDLYQQALAELGEPAVPLARRTSMGQADRDAEAAGPARSAVPQDSAGHEQASAAGTVTSGRFVAMSLLVIVGVGACGGVYLMTLQQDRNRRSRLAAIAGSKELDRSRSKSRR